MIITGVNNYEQNLETLPTQVNKILHTIKVSIPKNCSLVKVTVLEAFQNKTQIIVINSQKMAFPYLMTTDSGTKKPNPVPMKTNKRPYNKSMLNRQQKGMNVRTKQGKKRIKKNLKRPQKVSK